MVKKYKVTFFNTPKGYKRVVRSQSNQSYILFKSNSCEVTATRSDLRVLVFNKLELKN